MAVPVLLTTLDVARFVADGYLRFDAVVPDEINRGVLAELSALLGRPSDDPGEFQPRSGTPLSECYPVDSALRRVYEVPEVAGAIRSLVGANPRFDHHAIHFNPAGSPRIQDLHCDAAVDSGDPTFDIQLFYFPHDVEPGGGGTRFVPGTHVRRAPSSTIAAYQHMSGDEFFSGPAGSVMVFHHALWHAGQVNPGHRDRWMYKIRLNPTVPQVRRWNLDDFEQVHNHPDDHVFATSRTDSVAAILRRPVPWEGTDASRYDLMERVRLWRYLSGDQRFDADYYLTRHEQRSGLAR